MESLILKLQAEVEARKRPRWELAQMAKSAALGGTLCLASFFFGVQAAEPETVTLLRGSPGTVAAEGQIELQAVEIERLKQIQLNSARWGIPADLAERIEDIARAEGIDPELAFGLVRVESEFNRRAVSPMGAVGLTQLMPSTARYFHPGIRRQDLFDRDTNLRIGFRYLAELIERYDGDVRMALLAYNRGPERVDSLRRQGINPDNGYAALVMRPPPKRKP